MIPQSTLESETTNIVTTLGCAFSYQPYEPDNRIRSAATNKGSFTQKLIPLTNLGPQAIIEYSYSLITDAELAELLALKRSGDTFIFTGGCGDAYRVQFVSAIPKKKRGNWTVSGKFLINCIITEITPDCP